MTQLKDALDAAWGDFPPDAAYDWLRYTGNARPEASWVRAVVGQGARVTFIMETFSERSQQGFQAGVYDCQFAEARARQVHPDCASIAVVVSDGNYADSWDASEYGRGWASAATISFFPYGTPVICSSFIRGAGSSTLNLGVTWVPETWGSGTGLSQVVGYSPVPNTDLNHVWAPYYPGGVTPTPEPTPEAEDDDGMISVEFDGVDNHLWVDPDGKLAYRGYVSGAPTAVTTAPARDQFDYHITDSKGLVVPAGFGQPTRVYYAAGNKEAVVSNTQFGLIVDVI